MKILNLLFAVLLSFFAMVGSASAAVDTTAIVAGIGDASTAVLAIIAALLAMSTAIFGLVKVYNFVSRKAGA